MVSLVYFREMCFESIQIIIANIFNSIHQTFSHETNRCWSLRNSLACFEFLNIRPSVPLDACETPSPCPDPLSAALYSSSPAVINSAHAN